MIEKPFRKAPSSSDTNETSKAKSGRPLSMMGELRHEIYNNAVTIRKDQPTPVTNALVDDIIQHVPSHQEFHSTAKLYKL